MRTLLILLTTTFLFACKGEKTTNESNNPSASNSNGTITQKVTVKPDAKNSDIDVTAALAMMAKDKEIKVLDVRTPKEIKEGSYPNALQIDYNGDNFNSEINKLDKNDTYIVYCRSGGRSKKAVSKMKAFGFSKAYNMKDGYEALAKASK